jgi:hypothetical protein
VLSGANMNFDRLRFVAERAEVGEAREAAAATTSLILLIALVVGIDDDLRLGSSQWPPCRSVRCHESCAHPGPHEMPLTRRS